MTKARLAALASIVVGAAAALTVGAVTYDGVIGFGPGEEWGSAVSVAQDNFTQFGDQILSGWTGSELDEMYVRTDGYFLYVAATGNLQENGNAQILLLEVGPGGQNLLQTEIPPVLTELPCSGVGPPYALPNLGQALMADTSVPPQTVRDPASIGTQLDAGFAPNYAIAVDTFGHTVHVTQYDLSATALGQWDDPGTNDGSGGACTAPNETLDYFATRIYRGEVGVDSLSGVLINGTNPNASEFAYNNTGYAGVTGAAVAAAGSGLDGDPRTQVTGLEAKISLLDLGFSAVPVSGPLDIKVAMLLTSGGGLVSNQTLPGLAKDTDITNLDMRPDFTAIPGDQFASVSLTPAAFAPTIDGVDLVNKYGVANVVASQDTVTGFGDHPQDPDQHGPGSELDQMFAQSSGDLQIAITGNLQTNGNDLVIFLDTLPGVGEGLSVPLDANAGRIGNLNTDAIPLDADYAVVVNTWGGTCYVDLVDLVANTSTYMGASPAGSGNGDLTGGAAGPDWQVALVNTNVVGVDDNAGNDPTIQQTNALTATTGFEIRIPLSDIGSPSPGADVCMFALVSGGGYLSNQFLPAGVGGGWGNFGNPPVDLTAYGYHCMSVTLQAGCGVPVVTAITPNTGVQDYGNLPVHPPWGNPAPVAPVQALITGSNFVAGATVKLAQAGKPDIVGTSVDVVDASTITAEFDLRGAEPGALDGAWDVVVTTCATGTLPAGFTVSMCFTPRVDIDGDGSVDLAADFTVFRSCFNGVGRPFNSGPSIDRRKCMCLDADPAPSGNGSVDLLDFAKFRNCFNGPNRPPAESCGS